MLVGRETEIAHLAAVVRAARAGRSDVAVLKGPPGIGKTALLEHLARTSDGVRLVTGKSVETEAGLSLAMLSMIVRPLVDVTEYMPTELARVLAGAPPDVDGTDAFALGAGLLAVLSDAAKSAPLLLLLDDVHWSDEVSLRAVVFALRRLDRDSVGAVLALRDVAVPSLDAAQFSAIELRPLDLSGSASLLESACSRRLPSEVVLKLTEVTAGNPLGLVELARLLPDDALEGTSPLPEVLPVGDRIIDGYVQQISDLPSSTQRALLVVATAVEENSGPIVAALGAGNDDLASMEAAERAGLVRLARGSIAFRHPLMRAAVLGRADPAERRAAHRRWSHVDGLGIQARALHLAEASAGPSAEAVTALGQAAEHASGVGDRRAACWMWTRAAQLTPDVAERPRLLLAAATSAFEIGDVGRCQLLTEQALPLVADPLLRARLLALRGAVTMHDDPRQAHAVLHEAADVLAGDDVAASLHALDEAVGAAVLLRSPAMLDDTTERIRGIDPGGQDRAAFLRDSQLGIVLAANGRFGDGERYLASAISLAESSSELRADPYVMDGAAYCHVFFGRVTAVEQLAQEALGLCRRLGQLYLVPWLTALLGHAAWWRADWSRAASLWADAVSLYRAHGDVDGATTTEASEAWLAACRGDVAAARAGAEGRLAWAEPLGITRDRPVPMRILAMLDQIAGQPEVALGRLLVEADVPLDAAGVRYGPLTVIEDLTEAAIAAGRPEAAHEPVERLASYAGICPDPLASALAARCRAMLASGPEARDHFEQALAHHARDLDQFATARTRLHYGAWLRRNQHRGDAREQLRSALEVFDRLEAIRWSDHARAELRATGESVGPRHEAGTRLTAQELRVASAVAQGLTNREVAAQLYVSVKTVEYHLSSAFRKLGVRTRTELARRLPAEGY